MKRWSCPQCGSTCLAPRAPRKNDVRRFCLRCSEKTGLLVERSCRTAITKLEARAMKREVKAIFKKHKARSAEEDRWTFAGVDIRKAAKRYWRVLCNLTRSGELPEIIVRRSKIHPKQETGRAWSNRITMTFGVDVDRAAVEVTLLHELAHSTGAGHGHDLRYNKVFVQASKEIFEIGAVVARGYGPTRFIEAALRERYAREAAAS